MHIPLTIHWHLQGTNTTCLQLQAHPNHIKVALPAFLQPADVANKNAAAKIPGIQYKMLSFQLHTNFTNLQKCAKTDPSTMWHYSSQWRWWSNLILAIEARCSFSERPTKRSHHLRCIGSQFDKKEKGQHTPIMSRMQKNLAKPYAPEQIPCDHLRSGHRKWASPRELCTQRLKILLSCPLISESLTGSLYCNQEWRWWVVMSTLEWCAVTASSQED